MFGYNRARTRSRSRSRNRNRQVGQVAKWRPTFAEAEEADDEATLRPVVVRGLAAYEAPQSEPVPDSFKFCVQLAHGSPMALIPSNGSIPDLFKSISVAFGIDESDIIFCTVNSFKINMDSIFCGSLGFSDILFVHIKGQPIEVEMNKTEGSIGITIADNGMTRSFIKKLKEDGLADQTDGAIRAGQLIEKINGVNVLGLRHYEVARMIRNIPYGSKFTMRLVNPLESGFSFILPKTKQIKQSVENGNSTIRFKANGAVVVQQKDDLPDDGLISRLNDIFESYIGIQDNELAISLWETAIKCATLQEMEASVRESELKIFDFPDELIFDLWGIVSDWKKAKKSAEPIGMGGAKIEELN